MDKVITAFYKVSYLLRNKQYLYSKINSKIRIIDKYTRKGVMTATLKTSSGGGDKRDRTADLLHAMQALYQLSYIPL
jgi:hypothetical protein